MDYFELFEIPVQLDVDISGLKQKFFELSKKFHPDYHAGADDNVQAEVLEKAATLNKAWKTFQHRDLTIQYVLEQKGLMEKEEKYELPAGFLMEVLEINESLMDGEPGPDPELAEKIKNLEQEIYEPVKEIVEHYEEGITTEKELLQVKEYYYKKKYLDRIRKQLKS